MSVAGTPDGHRRTPPSAPRPPARAGAARRASGGTHRNRPGQVHGIAVEHAAEVQDDQVARRQLAVARPVMRHGRVRPGGDDGIKGRLVEPDPPQLRLDDGRHLPLASCPAKAFGIIHLAASESLPPASRSVASSQSSFTIAQPLRPGPRWPPCSILASSAARRARRSSVLLDGHVRRLEAGAAVPESAALRRRCIRRGCRWSARGRGRVRRALARAILRGAEVAAIGDQREPIGVSTTRARPRRTGRSGTRRSGAT